MEGAYRNIGFWFIGLVPVFLLGFWIPYFSEFPDFDPSITASVHIHAALLFTWLGILIYQPIAIRYRAFYAHRLVGRLSYFLTPLIAVFAAAMIRKEFGERLARGADILTASKAEFLSTVQLLLFCVFYLLAVRSARQRNIAEHMRYMICIAFVLLPAGLARALGYWLGWRQATTQAVSLSVIDLGLIGLIILDRLKQMASRPYANALAVYAVAEIFWLAAGCPV